MRISTLILLIIFAAGLPISAAMAAIPFPPGFDAAYKNFLRELPAAGKNAAWLTKLSGVTSQPKSMTVGGKPVVYLFACKNHSCDTDNLNLFLAPDHKSFKAVLMIEGAQTLMGGAGAVEVACVRKLDAAGGALDAC